MKKYDVRDKVALISGAAAGIGLALAQRLVRQGARVVLLDSDESACQEAAQALGQDVALALVADVRDRAAMQAAVNKTLAHFGQLDIVVANAGVVPPPASLKNLDPAEFDRVIGINLTGAFNTIQPALTSICEQRGHVVVVSSVAAFAPGLGGAAYMMSKAAVEQMGRALRLELAPSGATAGVAYFGIVDTAMARRTLDDHELGGRLSSLLPAPLRKRMSPEQAARVIADGIAQRAPRTLAPKAWQPYALMRGAANVLIDHQLSRSEQAHQFLQALESERD